MDPATSEDEFEIPRSAAGWSPDWGIVLGSGLGGFVDSMDGAEPLPYAAVAGLPTSRVAGHAGRFLYGQIGGAKVVAAQGRVHLYEGWGATEVTAGVRFMAALGVRRLILTNAAGAVNAGFAVGDWMMLSDHINLTGTSPLLGGPNFHDMTAVYAPSGRAAFRAAARRLDMTLREGVYAGLLGPQYETPAEIRMLRTFGADAVGMSTVLEAIQARSLGLEVVGFSCLTNLAAGVGEGGLAHHEVLEVGERAAGRLVKLLVDVLAETTISVE